MERTGQKRKMMKKKKLTGWLWVRERKKISEIENEIPCLSPLASDFFIYFFRLCCCYFCLSSFLLSLFSYSEHHTYNDRKWYFQWTVCVYCWNINWLRVSERETNIDIRHVKLWGIQSNCNNAWKAHHYCIHYCFWCHLISA